MGVVEIANPQVEDKHNNKKNRNKENRRKKTMNIKHEEYVSAMLRAASEPNKDIREVLIRGLCSVNPDFCVGAKDNTDYVPRARVVGRSATGKKVVRKEYMTLNEREAVRKSFVGRSICFESGSHEYWYSIVGADHHRFFLQYISGGEGSAEYGAIKAATSMLGVERVLGSKAPAAHNNRWKMKLDNGIFSTVGAELVKAGLNHPTPYKPVSKRGSAE